METPLGLCTLVLLASMMICLRRVSPLMGFARNRVAFWVTEKATTAPGSSRRIPISRAPLMILELMGSDDVMKYEMG